jgi:hypothetical protein
LFRPYWQDERPASPARYLERFPIRGNHLIEKESLRFKELEHVLIEKVDHLFRNLLSVRFGSEAEIQPERLPARGSHLALDMVSAAQGRP